MKSKPYSLPPQPQDQQPGFGIEMMPQPEYSRDDSERLVLQEGGRCQQRPGAPCCQCSAKPVCHTA